MARSYRSSTTVEVVRRTQRYFWPLEFLSGWLLLMMACGITFIAVFALNVQQQSQFGVPTPWLFPYGILVGALTVAFVLVINVLIISKNIIPGVVITLCVLFVALYMTGLIETGIQLFGPGIVNSECRNGVMNQPVKGDSLATLAWLELDAICNGWYTVFAFFLIGTLNLLVMIFVAAGVKRAQLENESEL